MGSAPRTPSSSARSFAERQPSAAALVDSADGRAWHTTSWVDLDAWVDRLAGELARFGGTRVVALLPQRAASIALLVACERARVEVVLVSALYGEGWARARREELDARALVTVDAAGALGVLDEGGTSTPIGDEPGVLVLTSGTTGRPKCARHTWTTIGAAVSDRAELATVRWLAGYPLSHFAALQVQAQALLTGATLLIPPDFSAGTALSALTTQSVGALCATPSFVRQLLLAAPREAWSTMALAQVTLGGEIADQRLLGSLKEVRPSLRITHVYASTELGAIVTVRDGQEGFDAALLDGERLKIVDGELHVRRGARAMVRYVGDAATRGDDGCLATGDRVEVTEGRARFAGRVDDLINLGGYKVSPIEIEAVVRTVEGVRDTCVVRHESSIVGAMPKVIVVPEAGTPRDTLQAAIVERCRERLAPHMVPRLFEFRDALDRSVAQKVVRRPSSG